jgi:hypothetical protein
MTIPPDGHLGFASDEGVPIPCAQKDIARLFRETTASISERR